jgi:ABC-type antimicrobial peptide transport system, ATPase component
MNVVELNGITKYYKEKCVLKDISLSIQAGEFFGIVGKSGSGKTTLLNIIGLIMPFDSGELVIGNKKNPRTSSKTALLLRRNEIGYLFQNFGLVDNQTVKWNLHLALAYKKLSKKEKENRIHQELNKFGLNHLYGNYVYQLSGGEQQRIAIIRLILQDSNIIIADEPTSSLDTDNETLVMSHLQTLCNQGKTVVMVTHNRDLLNYFTNTFRLDTLTS